MQILHPFAGSVQQYAEAISDPDRFRPDHCPQCQAKQPLTGHGFYRRTLVDSAFDGVIRVRRYLCRLCQRTVSLLPQFALPWLRFSLPVISLFLVARLLQGLTLAAAARAASQPAMPYQRGQFWIRRFRREAPALGLALAPLATPTTPTPDFVARALAMLESIGWIAAHRFLFSELRAHLLGWPRFLAPRGQRTALVPARPAP
jgi:transposase-like protein